MYRTIYVPVDNSEHSNRCVDLAVEFGRRFGATLIGCHVYAARLHDYRFKQMEFTLPEEYLEENELERQRRIHDSLISMGLQLISDSYLDVMQKRCEEAGIAFERKRFDGKHYKVLADDITASRYDLVILGALGLGAVKESLIGSVCERVVRRVNSNTLVVHDLAPLDERLADGVVVGIDGSPQALGALRTAAEFCRALGAPLRMVAVDDRSPDQAPASEEDAPDTGSATEQALERAAAVLRDAGVDGQAVRLQGKAFEQLLHYVRQVRPWLLVLGRNGGDAEAGSAQIGSCAENLLRLARCNLLLCAQPLEAQPQRAASQADAAVVTAPGP